MRKFIFGLQLFANTITNTNSGTFGTDGVYIDQIPAPAPSPTGPNTGLVAIIGTANWGPVDIATVFSDVSSLGYAFGNNSLLPNALLADAPTCMPECKSFLGVRVTDGTDTSATILIKDTVPTTLVTLTSKYTGALPNPTTTASPNTGVGAFSTCSLVASSGTGSPQYQAAIIFPGYSTETFTVNAFATPGSGYSASALIANLVAAVNGTVAGQNGSLRWTASAGSGTGTPGTGNFTASGGTNGTTTITTAVLIGTNSNTNRTGIFALTGKIQAAQYFLAGNTDPTTAATLAAFSAAEDAFDVVGFSSLLPTATAQADIGIDNMVSDNTFLTMDWVSFYDPFAGLQRLLAPMGKIAGIIASLPAYLYPGNKPVGGANGVISTDRASDPISQAEAALRQQSNLLYLTNNPNLFNRATGYGLPFGTTSSGKLISDVRMLKTLSVQLGQAFGPLVGDMQGPLPANGADTDPFRIALRDTADEVLQPYLIAKQIAGYTVINDLTNNTNTQIQQGFAFISIAVTTLSGVRFIVTFLQVGNTVQFQQQAA